MPRSRCRRRAFTLIELLVVIAIIAILVALLLPAVQAVREAARKSQCQDHLHNLGIGIHNYESAHKTLPSRQTGTGTNQSGQQRNRMSGFVAILPFVEQKPLYDAVTALNIEPWNNHTLFRDTVIDLYLCPSDPQGIDPSRTGDRRGIINYAFNGGDNLQRSRIANSTNVSDSIVRSRGTFGSMVAYRLADLTDGTSNVALMSERVRSIGTNNLGKVSTTNTTNPAACAAELNKQTGVLNNAYTAEVSPGFRWADGGTHFAFATILPPNNAQCFTGAANHWDNAYLTASSRHPGGAQAVMADAKVTFISENIDAGNQAATPPAENGGGASPYGVWGALGTKQGGETARVP